MDAVLQQLFDGKLYPSEEYYPKIEAVKEIRERNYKNYEKFTKQLELLNPALVEQFQNILDEQLDTAPFETYQMFVDGFRLGAKIIVEIFNE